MSFDDEFFDGIPSDDPPLQVLDRLPYARRVAELIQSPDVFHRWQQRCKECFLESRTRHQRHSAWERNVQELLCNYSDSLERLVDDGCPIVEPAAQGEGLRLIRGNIPLPDCSAVKRVEVWVPRSLVPGPEPYVGGPLPFSPRHRLSLADAYFVLAVVHDSVRRDAGLISPFDSDEYERANWISPDTQESIFWYVMGGHVLKFRTTDQVALDECIARVIADLKNEEPTVSAASESCLGEPNEVDNHETENQSGRREIEPCTLACAMLMQLPMPSITEIATRLNVRREDLYQRKEFERFRIAARHLGRMEPKGKAKGSFNGPKGHQTASGGVEAYEGKVPARPKRNPKSND